MTIQSKYSLGDTLWFMHDSRACSGIAVKLSLDLTLNSSYEHYTLARPDGAPMSMHVSYLFPSKQALLESL